MAKAAIEMGLWTIEAIQQNRPLHQLLGGNKKEVPCGIAVGIQENISQLIEQLNYCKNKGYQKIKIKINPQNADLIINTIRRELGDDFPLMADANCAYQYHEAIDIARKIENQDIFWFEEPLPPDDYDGYQKLSQSTNIPIATGENEYTKFGFRDLIKNRQEIFSLTLFAVF